MTKPNFKQMTKGELKSYVLAHREDEEAIHELFITRSNPNAKLYPAPLDEESIRIGEEAIRQKIQEIENKRHSAG